MKKILAFLCSLLLVMSVIVGCGGDKKEAKPSAQGQRQFLSHSFFNAVRQALFMDLFASSTPAQRYFLFDYVAAAQITEVIL